MDADVTVAEIVDREYLGVSESDGLLDTAELLLETGAGTAIVLRGTEAVGTVSQRDILQVLVEEGSIGAATARDAMTSQVPRIDPDEPIPTAVDRISTESTNHLIVRSDQNVEPLGLLTGHDLLASTTLEVPTSPEETDVRQSEADMSGERETTDAFDDQGICEVCGGLARELVRQNGQLLCQNCRPL